MSAMPMLAGVGLMMVCCSSASVAAMMMGGGEETPATAAGAGATTPVVPTVPSGQYVQVEHTIAYDAGGYDECEKSRIINLQEIEVYDKSGTKISLNVGVSSGKGFHGVDPVGAKFVDGIVGNAENFGHTICDLDQGHMDFVKLDLGSSKEIGKVILYNRGDGDGRINGTKVKILGTDGTTVVKQTPAISGAKYKHVYDFSATTPSWQITPMS
jgi:hypothetical protein